MKAYVEPSGIHHRTQAEAKASGRPFEPVDIPTDHKGLLDYVNNLLARPVTALPELADTEDENLPTTIAGKCAFDVNEIIDPQALQYQNGDPTRPFMGSRDPSAIFTCKTCGTNNRNP